MKVIITPSLAKGVLQAPPSKSACHRALIAAALSEGCLVRGVGDSADIDATLGCLKTMGAHIEKRGRDIYLGGLSPKTMQSVTMDAGESGSTLRFLIPMCLVNSQKVTFRGHGRLMQRPLTEYQKLCESRGFTFVCEGDTLTVCGQLQGGEYHIDGSRSSQFISGMLFVLPLLEGDSTLIIDGAAQSLSYIDLTLRILSQFGISVLQKDNVYFIKGGQHYRAQEIEVEGDWSNAAFAEALNLLGGKVRVTGLREDSTQGDKIYREYFKLLGSDKAMDLSDCPDLAPILFAMAAVYGGHFVGCKRLRLKESDRIAAMRMELKKCGITLTATEDTVSISPEGLHPPETEIDGQGDHRIVMAMAVLLTRLGGCINGAEAVGKSWREFFEAMKTLGWEIKEC